MFVICYDLFKTFFTVVDIKVECFKDMVLPFVTVFLVLISQNDVQVAGRFFSTGSEAIGSSFKSDIIQPNLPRKFFRTFLQNGEIDRKIPITYWPNGIVYYRFDFRDKEKEQYLHEAFEEMENRTCIR